VSAKTESLHWHIVSLGRSFSNCPQFRGKTNQFFLWACKVSIVNHQRY
jgi:hypothetical protein